GIEVELAQADGIAQRLTAFPELYFVSVTTGGYDFIVGGVFKSNSHYIEFLMKRLAKVPGVRKTITYHVLQVHKRRTSFLPAQYELEASQPPPTPRKRLKKGHQDD
ncbi:MAG: Lrp/AsnC ligand binding domain-containing protein, partial [Burkholderiaceae bacterium]|nr:Lrp/AsnC ligand binding domain-containing protein [Burkholderiaceae bacterium]